MLKVLLLLFIAYWVVRVARNLMRAMQAPPPRPPGQLPPRDGERRVWDREVEDARYRDL